MSCFTTWFNHKHHSVNSNNHVDPITGLQGPAGPPGPAGPQGLQGPQGVPGRSTDSALHIIPISSQGTGSLFISGSIIRMAVFGFGAAYSVSTYEPGNTFAEADAEGIIGIVFPFDTRLKYIDATYIVQGIVEAGTAVLEASIWQEIDNDPGYFEIVTSIPLSPAITPATQSGDVLSASVTSLDVILPKNRRILFVYRVTSDGPIHIEGSGNGSYGLTIEA